MGQLANVGEFCPNEECQDYGKHQEKQSKQNITKSGHTRNGTQQYRCRTCKQTFTETKGTIFYRRRTPMEEILEVLAFLAEGVSVRGSFQVRAAQKE